MKTLKENIKQLSENQKGLKNQRKTINLIGERTIETWKASYEHSLNRTKLREMYAALGLIKGLTIEQIESNPKKPINMNNVNKLIEKHGTTKIISVS